MSWEIIFWICFIPLAACIEIMFAACIDIIERPEAYPNLKKDIDK